jgi:hypothetical protein
MFWWFERRGHYVRCEVRFQATGDYEFAVLDADGSEHIERFTDASELAKREENLERELASEGWTGPHGWIV